MVWFQYNNTKNSNTRHKSFIYNYSYLFYIKYKNDINPYFKLQSKDNLIVKLQKLKIIYGQKFYYT